MPEIGQARAAVRERTTAPIVLLVQENLVAVLFQLCGGCPIAPSEMNDGRERRIRLDVVVRKQLRIHKPIRRHAFRVLRRHQLPGVDAVIHQLIVQPAEPAIQAIAQPLLGGFEPFAFGVHAMDEDDDTGQRHLLDADQPSVFRPHRHPVASADDNRWRLAWRSGAVRLGGIDRPCDGFIHRRSMIRIKLRHPGSCARFGVLLPFRRQPFRLTRRERRSGSSEIRAPAHKCSFLFSYRIELVRLNRTE
ncbi:hypothetical protein BCCR75501_05575 [Burkholderia sola]|nr:hypothetical protein BCCR75587_05594 [Burkholderia cenocepacia]CAG2371381.1 hypothetical protein BCCR75501_05575 [Burkholderia cenocepacia]CAG2388394.1 hypothetical protein BCCR75596_05597 [Burkholderia cenocepacia]CAG2507853.1 hypothetical protein BCCR75716_05519 [Burkholderia cenocepacia]